VDDVDMLWNIFGVDVNCVDKEARETITPVVFTNCLVRNDTFIAVGFGCC
jgi:phosphotransferase system IIA component